MSKKRKNEQVLQYPEILPRMNILLKEIMHLAREIGTNDLVLVAHLLVLDTLRAKKKRTFRGVNITRAGEGKKLKDKQ